MDEKITNWTLEELEKEVDRKGKAMSDILMDGSDAPSIIASLIVAKTSVSRLMANAVIAMDENEEISSKVMEACLQFKKVISPAIGAAFAMALGENLHQVKEQMSESESEPVDIDELSNQLFHGEKDD